MGVILTLSAQAGVNFPILRGSLRPSGEHVLVLVFNCSSANYVLQWKPYIIVTKIAYDCKNY